MTERDPNVDAHLADLEQLAELTPIEIDGHDSEDGYEQHGQVVIG